MGDAEMSQGGRFTGRETTGFIGLAFAFIGPAMGNLMDDLPDYVWIAMLIAGMAMFGFAVIPRVYEWLSERIGGCLSAPLIVALCLVVVVGIGLPIYNARTYKLSYRFCFNHDATLDANGIPRITRIYVSPQFINENNFVVFSQMTENSLRIGNAASVDRPEVDKVPIGANSVGWGYPDRVKFNPPRSPGVFTGEARYIFRDGKDASEPLPRKMTIKGVISGATSPDGTAGGFYFTPDLDSDANYDPTPCVVSKDKYRVSNK